jgi:hypothetical protein
MVTMCDFFKVRWILREVGWDGRDWIDLAQDLGGLCERGDEPPGSIKCWEVLE